MLAVRMIRWSPFFIGLSDEQVAHIARVTEEMDVEAGSWFFSEGEELDTFYLVQEGAVDITIGIPDRNHEHKYVDQITRHMKMEQITVCTIIVGEIFGWSAIIPPHESTASAIAKTPCRVIGVNYSALQPVLDDDCDFAYKLAIKAAQTVRGRLRAMRVESMAFI